MDTFEKDFKRKYSRFDAAPYCYCSIDNIYELKTNLDSDFIAMETPIIKIYRLFESVLVLMALTSKRFKYQQVTL